MNSKLSLLDQPNVDAVEARLQSVMHKLSQIADKKAAQDNPERQQKVGLSLMLCVKRCWQKLVHRSTQ